MNPNQPNGYQPYSGQLKNNQFSNYQYVNQPQFTQNTLNIPQSHNFSQGGSLSPSENHQAQRNKVDRMMYSSTIEPTAANKNFTFGKLQSMGRFVGNNDEGRNQTQKFHNQFTQIKGQQKEFSFQQNRQQKPNVFQPVNHNNQTNEFDRFPSFNLQQKPNNQQGFNSHYQGDQLSKQPQRPQLSTQTPEQKRRRQILAIKQQLEMINKKMQSSNLNKKYANEQQKNEVKNVSNYAPQSSGNSNINFLAQNGINSNNYLNTNTNSGLNSNNSYTFNSNSNNVGLSFNKSNQLNVGFQRNKGLATQSMIVTNEPSPGYKYQSIFDKYDSLKKPTYEAHNNQTKKDDKPLLLDKFVNKGTGFGALNKQKQTDSFSNKAAINVGNPINNGSYLNSLNSMNSLNTGKSSNNGNTANNSYSYDFISKINNKSTENNQTSNYTASSSSNYSTGSGSSGSSYTSSLSSQNSSTSNTLEAPKQGGGMFKKKKQNPYTQELKHDYLPTSPKNDLASNLKDVTSFKKTKPQNFQDNLVTNAMKQMKIEQSVEFKRQDFVVGKKLGKGQFGQVMLVQHKKTGFLCGMKVMEKKQIRDEKYEGQIARQLSVQFYLAHRNIAPLYGYFQDEKNVYLLVQYCTGGQLLQLLRKNRRMQEPQVSRIIRQIIQGIDYIHKQLIIHRDIKPENILFNFGVAKICDYGWAVYKGHGMRKTASVGSPLYYSPEIVMGVQYDQKIDIWDIGMMTYECLLGKIPFRIYSQLDLNRIVQDQIKFPEYIDTTDEAKDFILGIMKKKPEQRMEIREMLRHPFITKYQDIKLPIEIMKDFKEVLSS